MKWHELTLRLCRYDRRELVDFETEKQNIDDIADLTDEQIQEYAETMRLKAIKFLTEVRHAARKT